MHQADFDQSVCAELDGFGVGVGVGVGMKNIQKLRVRKSGEASKGSSVGVGKSLTGLFQLGADVNLFSIIFKHESVSAQRRCRLNPRIIR